MKQFEHTLAALFTFVVSCVTYMVTLSPTVSFWDCGEFIASAITLGIPHPPGSPLYLMIGKIFSMLPFGPDAAYRMNIISAIATALTVMILYLIIVRLLREFIGSPDSFVNKMSVYGGGIIGALTFAFTDTLWFNAVESEVYALSILFTALTLWLVLKWMDYHQELKSLKYLIACMYLFSLAVGVHLLNILVFPVVLLLVVFYNKELSLNIFLLVLTLLFALKFVVPLFAVFLGVTNTGPNQIMWFYALVYIIIYYFINKNITINYKLWSVIVILLFIGMTTYIMIYIRANLGPVINENDPSNWERFYSYWNREQYGTQSLFTTMFPRKAPLWTYQIKKMYLRYFAWNFMGQGTTLGSDKYIVETFSPKGLYYLPFLLGLNGIVYHFTKDWRRAVAILVMLVMMGIAIIIYLNQPDPQPRERDYVYVGSFFAFSIWIGIGVAAMINYAGNRFKDSQKAQYAAVIGMVGLCVIMGPVLEFRHNFDSHDRRGNYMAWDYSYNILESCEPDGILFTNGDNDTFPLWYLQEIEGIRKDVNIINLSLLNTVWYNKQLKHGTPPVPISLSDEEINRLNPVAWSEQTVSIPVPKEVYNTYIKDVHEIFGLREISSDTTFTFTLKPTITSTGGDQGIRVQDFVIEHIIQTNRWRRPVYFAMTVSNNNKIGLDRNLRIEGLAFKLVPFDAKNVSIDRLTTNLLEKFRYREVDNPEVYFDRQQRDLFQNLRISFLNAANFYSVNKMLSRSAQILDEMEARIPADIILFPNHQTRLQIAQIYFNSGELEKVYTILESVLNQNIVTAKMKKDVARIYAVFLNENEKAADICREVLLEIPFEPEAYSLLVSVLQKDEKYSEAAEYLQLWLERNPNDANAQSMLETIRRMNAEADSSGQN